MSSNDSFGVEDYAEKAETIDGGGPYVFDPAKNTDEHEDMVGDAGADPAFEQALEETQTEYREALDRLDDSPAETPIEDVPMEELKKIRLSRKRAVMELEGDPNEEPTDGTEFVSFVAKDDDGLIVGSYIMSQLDWDGFGRPSKITVGVVSGDILN